MAITLAPSAGRLQRGVPRAAGVVVGLDEVLAGLGHRAHGVVELRHALSCDGQP